MAPPWSSTAAPRSHFDSLRPFRPTSRRPRSNLGRQHGAAIGGRGPSAVIRLDAATVLLQWAVGGLFFLWVTTRRREVGIGYGWLLRACYLVFAVGALAAGRLAGHQVPVRDVSAAAVVAATAFALAVSIVRRRAGVAGERARPGRRPGP